MDISGAAQGAEALRQAGGDAPGPGGLLLPVRGHAAGFPLAAHRDAARLDLPVGKRADVLHDLGRRKRLAFHHRQIGTTAPVLFETGLQDGYRHGTTPNFTKVAVAGSDDLRNQIKPVTITAATERWALGQLGSDQPTASLRVL